MLLYRHDIRRLLIIFIWRFHKCYPIFSLFSRSEGGEGKSNSKAESESGGDFEC